MCKSVINPLPKKDYPNLQKYEVRVLHFNPSEIYDRINIDHFTRVNSVSMVHMFPKIPGFCACGCGQELSGRKTKWATDDCSKFAISVYWIINNKSEVVGKYLREYFGIWACCDCGVMDVYKEQKNGMIVDAIHKDHIIPVKHGGGGCWLSNYELRCTDCHRDKTNKDFEQKQYKPAIEYKLPTLFNMSEIF